MPTVTRIFIKTALVYACVGRLLSTLWLINGAWSLLPLLGAIQPTALHIIVIGWLTQLIVGVALWVFPVWSKTQPRGPEWLSWTCYGLLNAGLLLSVIAEPLSVQRAAPLLSAIVIVSAVLQVVALWRFAALVWPHAAHLDTQVVRFQVHRHVLRLDQRLQSIGDLLSQPLLARATRAAWRGVSSP